MRTELEQCGNSVVKGNGVPSLQAAASSSLDTPSAHTKQPRLSTLHVKSFLYLLAEVKAHQKLPHSISSVTEYMDVLNTVGQTT